MAKPTLQQAREQGFEPRRLGSKVRRLREEKGLSQDELAKKASVSKPAVSKLERGEVVPSIPILERLAGTLGVDLADLIRTGYDKNVEMLPTTLVEMISLAERMTEPQRRLALELMQIAARQKRI